MTTPLNIDDAPPVTTLQEARARVFDLVGHAIRRQLWLMLLDAHGQQLSLLIPIEGIPVRPEPGSVRRFAVGINGLLAQEAPGGRRLKAAGSSSRWNGQDQVPSPTPIGPGPSY